jgi:hypothetical protein
VIYFPSIAATSLANARSHAFTCNPRAKALRSHGGASEIDQSRVIFRPRTIFDRAAGLAFYPANYAARWLI